MFSIFRWLVSPNVSSAFSWVLSSTQPKCSEPNRVLLPFACVNYLGLLKITPAGRGANSIPSQHDQQTGVHKTHKYGIHHLVTDQCVCVYVSPHCIGDVFGKERPRLFISPRHPEWQWQHGGAWSCMASWEITFGPQKTKTRAHTHSQMLCLSLKRLI